MHSHAACRSQVKPALDSTAMLDVHALPSRLHVVPQQGLTVVVCHVQVNMNYAAAFSNNKTMITSYASS